MSERRLDIRVIERCYDNRKTREVNLLNRFLSCPTQELCPWELTAYVVKLSFCISSSLWHMLSVPFDSGLYQLPLILLHC